MTEPKNRAPLGQARHQLVISIQRVVTLGVALAVVVSGLAGCGDDDDNPAPTATVAATVAVPSPPSGATPRTGTELTVGSLADRMSVAWANVSSYRAVTTTESPGASLAAGSPVAGASPAPPGSVVQAVDEVVLPDRKRRIARLDGAVQYELLVVGGKVYARGPSVPALDATRADPNAWVEIDPTALDAASPYAEAYSGVLAPVSTPYSALSPEERARDAVPVGDRTVGGRTCAAYRIADTTETGERIEVVLSLGADDLPCSIETRVGGVVTTTIFEYNVPLSIEAPVAATPFAESM
ncbi:MAG: hypothetical protein QOG89_3109 [Thermomicrobiales bacterium]|nr:hypothetical protein [Thermomicrobiales bacterium]